MSLTLRLPSITGSTQREQLEQIKSYLYQFAAQLQWALEQAAPENTVSTVPAPAPATENFQQLKGLILKSADIVHAYYEKIDQLLKLSGDYTAASQFGSFAEKTENALAATHDQLRQTVSDLQAIFDENGNIRSELLVNGHIYSGILEYARDGEAIVGIEIGQTLRENGTEVFRRFARFTAQQLSFYDAMAQTEPVAYISNFQLYITNAWVKGNLKLGSGFEFDTANGLALRWVQEVQS